MKIADIEFEDQAFKACCLATGFENAEDVVKLICRDKKIENTKGLEYFTGLKLLDVTRNSLEFLDTSKNVLLEELFAGNNELKSLDLSNNINLVHLEVFINELNDLDISKNAKLEEIYASKNELSEINLRNNPELTDIRLSSNDLEDINLDVNSKLEKLFLDGNPLNPMLVAVLQEKLSNVNLIL